MRRTKTRAGPVRLSHEMANALKCQRLFVPICAVLIFFVLKSFVSNLINEGTGTL